jgi:uncharacterized protein involved in exopolysaccharide biosynthesis
MASVLSKVSVPGLDLPGQTNSSEVLAEILKSRTVGERVLQTRFAFQEDSVRLLHILDVPSVQMGLIKLPEITRVTVSEQGLIEVAVTASEPQLAAAIANRFVSALDAVNQEKSVSRAKNSRIYIENQLKETEQKLEQATAHLAAFQQENKTVSLEEQTKASILQVGELKGRIMAKEAEIGVMLESMKPENPLVVRAQQELKQIKAQYRELESQQPAGSDVLMAITAVPQVAEKLASLMREVKVQETIWQLLNEQYYQAKIEEARNTPTVQVLDPAVAPPLASWPPKKMIVLVSGIIALFLSLLWVFVLEYRQQVRERPLEYAHWQRIGGMLKQDLNRLKGIMRRGRKTF